MGAVLGACNLNAFAADQAGGIAAASVAHMRGFWDYEIAGHGNAAGIMQLESLYGLSPDNEDLAMTLCASYVGYAFGWVEVEAEQADDAGDYDRAEQERLRAELLYRRARDIAVRSMRNRDTGIDQALRGRQDQLKAYLQKHYDDPEDDVGLVFWAAASWGGLLGMSDDASLAMDLPAIVAMVQHVASLDPGYEDAGALVFLGGFNSQFPAQFGGSPQKGREYFERALSITDRRAHQVHLNYARLYAVTVGDRELFLALTREIIDAPDQGSSVRLANKIARRRAQLLLSRVDMLF
ncbi:MAG: TRAP transporter TatT component family protein [Myxococcales bacterium]|nr:TRAP transporter TatT component family protein [Myxococcales bacterium]MDD9970887.1 TRAP transporter TatT component family protein [Myxococcales bacterium]